jgi:hypothetical protein
MTFVDIIPLESAGQIKLGMAKSEVLNAIGHPKTSANGKNNYQFNDIFFSVFYDKGENVNYIEYSEYDDKAKILVYGIDVFKTPASDLIDQIVKQTGHQFDPDEKEIPYCYIFPELELSFWRPVFPEDEHDEDGKYFITVGIGTKGYYTDKLQI